MKNITFFLSCFLLVLISSNSFGQQDKKESLVRDGVYDRETIPQRLPIPYPHLRESDMLWTKRIWRILDLRQRMNHPLYFPTVEMQDRQSLVQRLMDAIRLNEINAYDPGIDDDEFTTLFSYNQILERIGAQDEERQDVSPITGRDTTIIIKGRIPWEQFKEFEIKEEWFFDKQHSTVHVRVIGICPIRVYEEFIEGADMDDDLAMGGEIKKQRAFWVYYPHARSVLANTAVFNPNNDAQRNSFDDIFFKRMFSSYIVKESNVFDNRRVDAYTFGGIPNMQESDRIRQELFLFEHDLWEY